MSRPLLLDTCAAIYLLAAEPMTEAAYAAMDDAVDALRPLFVSPIAAWEVGLKASKGRFAYPISPRRWLEKLRDVPGIRMCELNADILLKSSFLPGMLRTRDPADRIIAATAREFGYTVMTRDESLLDYGRQGHLSVLEC